MGVAAPRGWERAPRAVPRAGFPLVRRGEGLGVDGTGS